MNKKDYMYGMKMFNWIKGGVLAFIGILITRWDVGFGRFTINIYFGLPIYFLIACSGMLVALILKIEESPDERKTLKSKKLEISSAVLYVAAFITSIVHTIRYNLDVLNVFLLAFIGVAWFLSVFYGKTWNRKNLLANILISLSFSLGIIYGAAINGSMIPISIFIFFGAIFLLQFSKDLINESKNEKKYNRAGAFSLASTLGVEKTQKISIILDLVVILLLILPFIPNFVYMLSMIFYMILMIITVILLGIAALLTYKMKAEKTYYRTVKILLRIGMFFLYTGLILAYF
ncbi:MAG: UbiA family prenyltransferase [Candidatus Lokiarchaeota archaeon]|nr:UbiA family prenyltransferase [Candidatus Lokiarchaeota archaeon]